MGRVWALVGGVVSAGIVVSIVAVGWLGRREPLEQPAVVTSVPAGGTAPSGASAGGLAPPSAPRASSPPDGVGSGAGTAVAPPDRKRDPREDRLRPVGEGVSDALGPIAVAHEAFLELDVIVDVEGLPPEEQDRVLKAAVREKREALTRLEAAYRALLDDDPSPAVREGALERLGDAYDHLGVSLEQATLPSYLNEQQVEIYRMGMSRMAAEWYAKADATWDGAGGE